MPEPEKPGSLLLIARSMATPLRFLLGSAVAAGGAARLLVACGPSMQSIYDGNVRFEHCYRLDLDTNISPTHRRACWAEWKRSYTYGQSGDRIDYATRRLGALASGDASRPLLALDAGSTASVAAAESPLPANLHVSPPPTVKPVSPASRDAGAEPRDAEPPRPPEAECTRACQADWAECGAPCRVTGEGDAAKSPSKSCKACDADYKKCMRRCLK